MEKIPFVNPFRSLQFIIGLVFIIYMFFVAVYFERTRNIDISSLVGGASIWWLLSVYLLWLTGHNTGAWLVLLLMIVITIFGLLAIMTIPTIAEQFKKRS